MPDEGRSLTVGSITVQLDSDSAVELSLDDILYPCGEEHDLHLNPEREFTLSDVERIIEAIRR